MNEYNRNYLDKPESPEDPGDRPSKVQ
jgi:hypothetical protein